MENDIVLIPKNPFAGEYEYYCSITDKLDEYILNKKPEDCHHLNKSFSRKRIAIFYKKDEFWVSHNLIGFITMDDENNINYIKLYAHPEYYKDSLDSISKEMTDLYKGKKCIISGD